MPWDPAVYERFQAEREAPFDDLVSLIHPREGMRVIDLGCGTGELTSRLAERLPGSDVLGIDSSAEMLAKAAPRAREGLRFEQRRIEDVGGTYDLVFSHAALQWVDDHRALIPRVFSLVAPGGQVVEMDVKGPLAAGMVAAAQIVDSLVGQLPVGGVSGAQRLQHRLLGTAPGGYAP